MVVAITIVAIAATTILGGDRRGREPQCRCHDAAAGHRGRRLLPRRDHAALGRRPERHAAEYRARQLGPGRRVQRTWSTSARTTNSAIAIAALCGYTVSVATSQSSALAGVPAAAARRIDITVSYAPSRQRDRCPATGRTTDMARACTARDSARHAGFTLIELVITITVGSVVVAFMALFIVMPMNAYPAPTRRPRWSMPPTARCASWRATCAARCPTASGSATSGTVTALELLATADGARYQDGGPALEPGAGARLHRRRRRASRRRCRSRSSRCPGRSSSPTTSSIYNVGVPGANAYEMANVITPAGTTITVAAGATANQNLVTLNPAFNSPSARPASASTW